MNCQKAYSITISWDCVGPDGSQNSIGALEWVKTGTLGGTAAGGDVTINGVGQSSGDSNTLTWNEFTSILYLTGPPNTTANIRITWNIDWVYLGGGSQWASAYELYQLNYYQGNVNFAGTYGGHFNTEASFHRSGSYDIPVPITFDSNGCADTPVWFDFYFGASYSTISGTVTVSLI